MTARGIGARLRRQVEHRAQERCEYCRAPQIVCGYTFHVDHVLPTAGNDISNLALSCAWCNLHKATSTQAVDPETQVRVALYHPRQARWANHFKVTSDGKLIGTSPTGRATVNVLDLNHPLLLGARQHWMASGLM